MQSFRERSCFHGNQHCYQQGPYELSRLESYRHQRSQTRQGYEAHSLAAAPSVTAAASVAKDCYSQQAYPGYGNGSAPAEKQYKGAKIPSQQLQGGYSGHLGGSYSGPYMGESHLQQKWADASQMTQYDQEGGRGSGSQYVQSDLLTISQSQCPHVTQSSTSVYTSCHQQKLPQDTSPSPAVYTRGQSHFPQHSQSLSPLTPSYVEKCNLKTSQCYKSYAMTSNSQYSRHAGSSNSLKQNSYRAQSSYVYQQPPSRSGYEQRIGMPNSQDNLSKYQHFTQPQQSYCLTDLSVRSPEQYYQNCSPSTIHSPARSVGRSPTYSSTPSPLMVSSESYQYSQPTVTSGTSSSTSLQDQGLLMPQKSHSLPAINHKATSYTGSLKDRFSEKLLSNPSLWSLNALTSQVENVSNVQQLLLSEAVMINKKGSKRINSKQDEDFKDPLNALMEGLGCDKQHTDSVTEAFSNPQTTHIELPEVRCSTSSDVQLERNYYYCNQNRDSVEAITHCKPSVDGAVPSSVSLSDNISKMSGETASSLQIAQAGDNVDTLLKTIGEDKVQNNIGHTPNIIERNCQEDIDKIKDSLKEDFEDSSLFEKLGEERDRETVEDKLATVCSDQTEEATGIQDWVDGVRYPSVFSKTSQTLTANSPIYAKQQKEEPHLEIKQRYITHGDFTETSCGGSNRNCFRDEDCDSDSDQKKASLVCKDDYVGAKENNSDSAHLDSKNEPFEDGFSTPQKEKPLEEQQSVIPSRTSEVKKERESFPSSKIEINNKTQLQAEKPCSTVKEQADRQSKGNVEEERQGMAVTSSDSGSATRDVTPSAHCVTAAFPVFNEEATLVGQSREHIDRRDAAELEPDSPQLPGKSIMHSAPSWADTPPSPKKGDEEIDPKISCVIAVTPSTKSEPMATSANLRAFSRRHARGRQRQSRIIMRANARVRTLSDEQEEGPLGAVQETSASPPQTVTSTEQKQGSHSDLSSQASSISAQNFPSRMCTRSLTATAMPSLCLHLKRGGSKASQQFVIEDSVSRSKGLISKIGWKKQRGPKPAFIGHAKGRRGLSEITHHDENQDATLCLAPFVKDQNPMVLRSRKQAQENPLEEKATERRSTCLIPTTIKELKQEITLLKDQCSASSIQNLASSLQKSDCQGLISRSDDVSEPTAKRKFSIQPTVPVKKQRTIKISKLSRPRPPLKNNTVSKSPRKRLNQAENFNLPLITVPTKDTSPVNDSDVPTLPSQYPAKTKYLPPRKGRGLKYEAMVQKITSPGSKKQSLTAPSENVLDNVTKKSTQQIWDQKKTEQAAELGDSETAMNSLVLQGAVCAKTSEEKERKGKAEENCDLCDVASGPGSLVVNTQRVAKQRAIKNNHEMHLKQRRKRRSLVPRESTRGSGEPTLAHGLAPKHSQEKVVGSPLASTEGSMCRKGMVKPHPARKAKAGRQGRRCIVGQKAVGRVASKRVNARSLNHNTGTEKEHEPKSKDRKRSASLMEEEQREMMETPYKLCKLPTSETLALFRPYVHIDRMAHFSSLCTIINRLEEELLFFQARKRSFHGIQSTAAVAKAIPSSSVMLQGPLVNKSLADRSLACCLCGKSTNYKELGDLCGPYYPEDCVPRKALCFKYRHEFWKDNMVMNCSMGRRSNLKIGGTKAQATGGASARLGRVEKCSGGGGCVRPRFLERYKMLHQLQGSARRAGQGEPGPLRQLDGRETVLQGLVLKAESREHWLHEACAAWTTGVYLVAGKLYGVEEAARSTAKKRCSACQEVGASMRCCSKGCHENFHYFCAREIGCVLDEDSFSLTCTKHKAL